jgi:hypothetical protein
MQYAADDSANVSFRSINVWLRHFKRAHHIKTMDDDELARLPTTFTPAMDMAGASQGVGNTEASATGPTGVGDTTDANGGTTGSPTASLLQEQGGAMPSQSAPTPPALPIAAADDVSSYMTNMELSHAPSLSHQSFLLQNHASALDLNAANPYQMLMLSTTPLPPPTVTAASHSLVATDTAPLHTCVQLAQKMTSDLARFETAMAVKLDSLDTRVQKLCFRVLTTTATTPIATAPVTTTTTTTTSPQLA